MFKTIEIHGGPNDEGSVGGVPRITPHVGVLRCEVDEYESPVKPPAGGREIFAS